MISAEAAIAARPDVAIFSAGGGPSRDLAPKFAEVGCRVVDNSSYWRMDPTKKLVIPEINPDVLSPDDYIIANPNCSTIQMLLPLAPLHRKYIIKRIVVSTYQSVTGSGNKAVAQMEAERNGGKWGEYPAFYNYPIDQNVIPHIDVFLEDGYTKEERKMMDETHKILGDDKIGVSATTARVPVIGGHSESINLEFEREFDLAEVRRIWRILLESQLSTILPRTSIRCRFTPSERTTCSSAVSAATLQSRTDSTSGACRTISAREQPQMQSRLQKYLSKKDSCQDTRPRNHKTLRTDRVTIRGLSFSGGTPPA